MNCANHPDTAPVAYCRTCGKPLCAELHPRREGCDLLRELPGGAAARRPADKRAARGRIRFVRIRANCAGKRAESRVRRYSRPDSFPLAWARSTAGSMPRVWPTW